MNKEENIAQTKIVYILVLAKNEQLTMFLKESIVNQKIVLIKISPRIVILY